MAKKKKTSAPKPAKAAKPRSTAIAAEKPPWNVYSTMLLLSLLAVILGCVLFLLELSAYDWKANPKPSDLQIPQPSVSSVQFSTAARYC